MDTVVSILEEAPVNPNEYNGGERHRAGIGICVSDRTPYAFL